MKHYKRLTDWHSKSHHSVNHGMGQYVVRDNHTNGIESFWATFKRGYIGVYHQMSKKHLQKYIHEFTYRYNYKDSFYIDFFNSNRTTYKILTGK